MEQFLSDVPEVPFGTMFAKKIGIPRERKRWIKSLHRRGTLLLDGGAIEAVSQRKTLFAAGILNIRGNFTGMEAVNIADKSGKVVACGLVNFSNEELDKIKGQQSDEIMRVLGQSGAVVERYNLVLDTDEIPPEVH